MAYEVFKGNFTKSTNTSVPVDQSVTGTGFQPKAIIFWITDQTAAGNSTDVAISVGITDGTTDYSVGISCEDAQDPTNTGLSNSNKAMSLIKPTDQSILAECDLKSLDSDGFTLTWTTNDANAYIIHYLALGGADLTDIAVKTFAAQTSPGSQAVTGTGFQPDCLIFLSVNNTGAPNNAATNTCLTLGMAVSSSQRATVQGFTHDNSATPDPAFRGDNTACLGYIVNKSDAAGNGGLADFVSMDSDGFTITWGSGANAAYEVAYLALKGGQYHIQSELSPVNDSDVSYTGTTFPPKGLLFYGPSRNATIDAHIRTNIGGASGPDDEGNVLLAVSSTTGFPCDQRTSTDKSIAIDDPPLSAGLGEANLLSLDSNGYSVHWTVPTSRRTWSWLAFGDTTPTPPTSGDIRQTVYY